MSVCVELFEYVDARGCDRIVYRFAEIGGWTADDIGETTSDDIGVSL